MGGAPYLAVIYRNAAVVRLAGRFAGVTRDARALQRCRELAKGAADAKGAEMAVGKALWDAEVPVKPICDLMTVAVDSLDVELRDEDYTDESTQLDII